MAFNIRSLTLYASCPVDTNTSVNFYKYATKDAVATFLTANHADIAAPFNKLKVGDTIDAVCGIGGTVDRVSVNVTSVSATAIAYAVNVDASGT